MLLGGQGRSVFAQGGAFFSGIQDMPLMPGLTELADQGVAFDKPGGRIVESVAYIDGPSAAEIEGFYGDTLPQLGWRRIDARHFVRGGERLALSFEDVNTGAMAERFLRILVHPDTDE